MADVFLSYARAEEAFAKTLAELLEDNGLTVWWDRKLRPGDRIHEVVDRELENANAVVVLWSAISVKSDWVHGEAQTGYDLKKLVPIKISECKLPINYRGIQTAEVYKSETELNSLRKNLGIGALAVFLPRVLGRSGCCEQTLT
jgi:hypothetical protein